MINYKEKLQYSTRCTGNLKQIKEINYKFYFFGVKLDVERVYYLSFDFKHFRNNK